MHLNAVTVPVITSIGVECTFWPEDDGWKGCCTGLGITVPGGNFNEAKKNMANALQAYISSVLRDRGAKIAA